MSQTTTRCDRVGVREYRGGHGGIHENNFLREIAAEMLEGICNFIDGIGDQAPGLSPQCL